MFHEDEMARAFLPLGFSISGHAFCSDILIASNPIGKPNGQVSYGT